MVSSSGSGATSGSGSARLTSSGSDGQAMDQRRQRRMLSNRESARRSRMRKQKHLDDLTAQAAQLRRENGQIVASCRATTQQYLAVEAENSVLRTQIMELASRLQALDEILQCLGEGSGGGPLPCEAPPLPAMDSFFMSLWSLHSLNQPITASADMFQC